MSRDSATGIYTRVSNSFSQPVTGTTIDPSDADTFFDDVEAAMNSFIGTSTTSLAIGAGPKTFTTQTGKTFIPGTFVQAISQASAANYMYGTVTSYDSVTGALVLDVVVVGGSGTLADWNIFFSGARGGVGTAATIAAGTTTTGAAGTSAAASNSGTSSAAILDFTIPRGADAGLRYAFESSTSMAAPASGGLRLNNAALASVTAIAVNATNSDAVDVSDWIATWDDSTNTVKGYVEVRKEGSGAVLGHYQLTSVTDNTTWLEFAVTYVSGSGSFTAADSLYLTPYLTGNAGTNGAVAVSGTPTVNQITAWVDATTVKGVSITGLVKGNGASAPAAATQGVDYYAPSGTDVDVADGGTGSSTAAGALTNLTARGQGKETIFIPAAAMISRTTNGAASGSVEMTTNKNMFVTKDFDASTQEFCQFEVFLPKSWNLGTVTFRCLWSHASTTTNFGVVFGLAGVARSDDDAGDVAFGTAQTCTDTGGTTNDIYISPESSAITIAGTPAAGDSVQFQIARNVSDGSDTMAIDARLHGIQLFFTTNAVTDA